MALRANSGHAKAACPLRNMSGFCTPLLRVADFATMVQEWLDRACLVTTTLHDHHQAKVEGNPTFQVKV